MKDAYVVGCVRTGNLDAACNAPAKPLGVVVFVEAEAKHPRLSNDRKLAYDNSKDDRDEGRTAPEKVWKKGLSI